MPRATFRAAVAVWVLLIPGFPAGAVADVPEDAYRDLNRHLVQDYALPRYDRLKDATAAFGAAAGRFCKARSAAGLAGLRGSYHGVMDAWMGVSHLRFGPAELLMRAPRLYFWPQARGKVAKPVADLLASGDVGVDQVSKASVAAQGLPAVEWLLYSEASALLADGGEGARRCALLEGIAANMQQLAAGIGEDWRGGRLDYAAVMARPGPENTYYRSHKDAALDWFKSLHDGLQVVLDLKLQAVAGKTLAGAKPRLAESRASGRSMRNIVLNLEAAQALYLGRGETGFSGLVARFGGDEELDPLLRKAFRLTLETARSIDAPLTEAVADPGQRPKVDKLMLQVQALKQIIRDRLARALGLSVGFNALDGD